MGILIAAGLVAVVLFVLLGVFGGSGGPSETPGTRAPTAGSEDWIARLGPDGLERLLIRLFTAMRCDVEQSEARCPRPVSRPRRAPRFKPPPAS